MQCSSCNTVLQIMMPPPQPQRPMVPQEVRSGTEHVHDERQAAISSVLQQTPFALPQYQTRSVLQPATPQLTAPVTIPQAALSVDAVHVEVQSSPRGHQQPTVQYAIN